MTRDDADSQVTGHTDTAVVPTAAAGNALYACVADSLDLTFPSEHGAPVSALRNVSVALRRGRTTGVVGESGSGKSMLGLALLGLHPANGRIRGSVVVEGVDMVSAPESDRRRIRRDHVSLILQDPGTAMNPVRKVQAQMEEALAVADIPRKDWAERIGTALTEVGLDPSAVLKKYPFQLSGGMQQRVVIAMAIMRRPTILVADEPTTALDVTTQVSVLGLIAELQEKVRPGVLFISHDLSVIRQVSDDIIVLYGGRIFETGPTADVIGDPRNPYTFALLSAIPKLGRHKADLVSLPGYPEPARIDDPGCPFRQRCPRAIERCAEAFPEPTTVGRNRTVSCFNPVDAAPSAPKGGGTDARTT